MIIILICTLMISTVILPVSGNINTYKNTLNEDQTLFNKLLTNTMNAPVKKDNKEIKNIETYEDDEAFWLDKTYHLKDPLPVTNMFDNDDAGYKRDAGDEFSESDPIYPGEMIDNWPGRGRTGKLNSTDEDWYVFSVCDGQDIIITMTPPTGHNYDIGLWDDTEHERETSTNPGSIQESISFTADKTDYWYLRVYCVSGSGEGQYSFEVTLSGQNDANTGKDAGDSFATATSISFGLYEGYLDMNDEEDWYKFDVNEGQNIHFTLLLKNLALNSDFDIYLYNPSGTMVYSENYYYNDELSYPINETGTWRVRVKIFPGYTDAPDPTEWEYFTYGSGAYKLQLSTQSTTPDIPDPITQPDITPIAQTFKIANDPDSNKDEYGYLAAIPACNYLEGGERYLAPIVYTGDTTLTNWFGTVDDTTEYLLDDWNIYLSDQGKTAVQYNIPSDPIHAAAEIATQNWISSDLAVVAIDGSNYEDTTEQVLHETKTLPRNTQVQTIPSSSFKIKKFGSSYFYPMKVSSQWGAINVSIYGPSIPGGDFWQIFPTLIQLYPKFMALTTDWWPEYDNVPRYDMYYPVTTSGYWAAGVKAPIGEWDFIITKYECDRYEINVDEPDTVLNVTITTPQPSDLLVFLVDPQGHVRAPDIPDWNGGPINPIHEWNGIDDPNYPPDCDLWRSWNPDPHTEFSAEVLHPEKGTWTAIVVPRNAEGSSNIEYTIDGEIRKLNQKRINAAVSAANGAVIASQEHVPLLYVKEDSVPAETQNAFTSLGVNKVIFVENDEIGTAVRNDLPTLEADLKSYSEIVDYIKDYPSSENYITITSLKTGDGYFAPSAMIAAYHGSPVLRLEEAKSAASSAPVNYNVFAGIIEENVYVMDISTGEILWGNPTGWNPQNTAPVTCPEGTVYLGSTKDTIFLIGDSISSTSIVGSEEIGGDLFLNIKEGQVYRLDENGDEEPLPLFGSAESPNPAGMANRIDTWRLWGGDYYHGNRAPGHLPIHDKPISKIGNLELFIEIIKYISTGGKQGDLPPLGMDAKRYWNEEMYKGIYKWIGDYGLDLDGPEALVFVAPRKDIRLQVHSVMMGNNSYAGHIPGDTPAYTSDIIVRNILYPALIFANPGRDVTTTQFMNFPDGESWKTNDGNSHAVYSTRDIKNIFMSHGRTYDGHCLWEAHLERMNEGASVMYYSGHGTGGSGISAQYLKANYSNYPDQIWPDAWRGYMYDDWKTARDNGRRWYNPEPPNLYDFIHYKWMDQLFGNLRSNAVFYMSCSTGQQFGPMVYLDHGAVLWYGNAGAGLSPEGDLLDQWFFQDAMINGIPVGLAYSKYIWLHYRDFTTGDMTSMYGDSSMYGGDGISTINCIYGDPNLILYSPEWTAPIPVDSVLDI